MAYPVVLPPSIPVNGPMYPEIETDSNGNVLPTDTSSARATYISTDSNPFSLVTDAVSGFKEFKNNIFAAPVDSELVNSLYDKELQAILLQHQMNQTSADKANAFTKEMQEAQYLYNRLARRTEYQDRISDLKAAGLNPLLALQNGSPSSFSVSGGSGVSASVQKSEAASLGMDFLNVLSDVYGHTAKSLTDIYGHTVGLFGKLFK